LEGLKLMIAGGGTGGHLYCGLAIAEEWKARFGTVIFVGTPQGLEVKLVPAYQHPLILIRMAPLKGKFFLARLKALFWLPYAMGKSFLVLIKEKPNVVLGIGGYVSGPFVLVARMFGFKTAVIDQNAIPGFTNRLLGKWVHLVFLTFEGSQKFFSQKKIRFFGNPVLKERVPINPRLRQDFGGQARLPSKPLLLICGGSQGAHVLNETMLKLYPKLVREFPHLVIVHQTGPTDFDNMQMEAQKISDHIEIKSYIDNMAHYYRLATCVVARSGAGTITELALWGLASILIPYPFAADDHQLFNARELEKKKAAFIVEQKNIDLENLFSLIKKILSDDDLRKTMEHNAKQLAKPRAASDVAESLKELCE